MRGIQIFWSTLLFLYEVSFILVRNAAGENIQNRQQQRRIYKNHKQQYAHHRRVNENMLIPDISPEEDINQWASEMFQEHNKAENEIVDGSNPQQGQNEELAINSPEISSETTGEIYEELFRVAPTQQLDSDGSLVIDEDLEDPVGVNFDKLLQKRGVSHSRDVSRSGGGRNHHAGTRNSVGTVRSQGGSGRHRSSGGIVHRHSHGSGHHSISDNLWHSHSELGIVHKHPHSAGHHSASDNLWHSHSEDGILHQHKVLGKTTSRIYYKSKKKKKGKGKGKGHKKHGKSHTHKKSKKYYKSKGSYRTYRSYASGAPLHTHPTKPPKTEPATQPPAPLPAKETPSPAPEAYEEVEASPFGLKYILPATAGIPRVADYDALHELTYEWLATIMHRSYGQQLVEGGWTTKDVANIYAFGDPVEIVYKSSGKFRIIDDGANIPTQANLDMTIEQNAFTGRNMEFYREGVKQLEEPNIFRQTTEIQYTKEVLERKRADDTSSVVQLSSVGVGLLVAAVGSLVLVFVAMAKMYGRRRPDDDDDCSDIVDCNEMFVDDGSEDEDDDTVHCDMSISNETQATEALTTAPGKL